MTDWAALGVAFGTVFLAELGDKTQLGVVLLASRIARPWTILVAASLALATSTALAVGLGASLGAMVPQSVLQIGSGVVFLAFGAWFLLQGIRGAHEEAEDLRVGRGGLAVALYLAILLAEMGDKTQIAAGLLASSNPWLGTFLGASAALALNTALGVVVGRWIGGFPAKARSVVVILAALAFLGFGFVLVLRGVDVL
ncbi:MAG: TMEM165/GDT1 family protein [Myxococcota bacterium]